MKSKNEIICGKILYVENVSPRLTRILIRGTICNERGVGKFDDFALLYRQFSPEYKGCSVVLHNEQRRRGFFLKGIHQDIRVEDGFFEVDFLSNRCCRKYERDAKVLSE